MLRSFNISGVRGLLYFCLFLKIIAAVFAGHIVSPWFCRHVHQGNRVRPSRESVDHCEEVLVTFTFWQRAHQVHMEATKTEFWRFPLRPW